MWFVFWWHKGSYKHTTHTPKKINRKCENEKKNSRKFFLKETRNIKKIKLEVK